MKILGIETSCDETAISVMECSGEINDLSFSRLSHNVLSQIDIHAQYGGVFPALAKREHAKNILPLLEKTLKEAGLFSPSENTGSFSELNSVFTKIFSHEEELLTTIIPFLENVRRPQIDAIAVTVGPGLEPALWVGLNVAKALSLAWDIPVIPTNHLEGHIASVLFDPKHNTTNSLPKPPSLALIISGGHTELVSFSSWGVYEYQGGTIDDAVGEAYDKVARMLGLPYPGGPEISRLADRARGRSSKDRITFPRPLHRSPDLKLSFSGLKTAVLYEIKRLSELDHKTKEEVALGFEEAVADVLTTKAEKALHETSARSLIVTGGVAANRFLRERFEALSKDLSLPLHIPDLSLTTDNAIMIALAGYISYINNRAVAITDRDALEGLSVRGTERIKRTA